MADVYWYYNGVSQGWDEPGNWWDDSGHTSAHGAIPMDGDNVYFIGTELPTTGPATPVSVNNFDATSWLSPGPYTGFDSASVTTPVVVMGHLLFGSPSDTYYLYCAVDLRGNVTHTVQGSTYFQPTLLSLVGSGWILELRDTVIMNDGAFNATGLPGILKLYDSALMSIGTVTLPGSTVEINGSSAVISSNVECADITAVGTLTGGTSSCTTLSLNGGSVVTGAAVITCTTVYLVGGLIDHATINIASSFNQTGGTVGDAGYGTQPTINGGTVATYTMSGGYIYTVYGFNLLGFSQSGGSIIGSSESQSLVTIACSGGISLTGGSASAAIISTTDSINISSGYALGATAKAVAGGNVVVDSISSFNNGTDGVYGYGTTIKGKQNLGVATYLTQGGRLALPDFTRGKNPFGGGVFS